MFPDRYPRSVRHGRCAVALTVALAVALAATVACGGGGGGDEPPVADIPISTKAKVKFKGSDRLLNDFAQALALDKAEVCNELGLYSCTNFVHKVPLGGAAPYDQGVFEPLSFATLTSPIAADRVALSACILRADRDLAGAGVIYVGLDLDERGALRDVAAESVTNAIDTLYKRAVQRRAQATEIAHLQQLYRDIESTGGEAPAREWAVLSCFAVMTTLEQLFY